jgi:hypothetical protein
VIVRVGEARHDRHLLGVERARAFRGERFDVGALADGDDAAATDGECLGPRQRGIHRVDLRVEHDEIRVGALREEEAQGARCVAESRRRRRAGKTERGHSHEFPAALSVGHRSSTTGGGD